MTQRKAFFLAVFAVSQLLTVGAQAGQVLKVLQLNFNDEIVTWDDRDEHIRERRFAAIVEFIRRESPDVVFIEEGWNYKGFPSLAIPLAKEVGYDYFYRVGEGFPLLLWDSDIVLAKKEFHMREKRKVQLVHSAWHIGDEINWIIPFGSITNAVGARLTLADGQSLLVYATHLIGTTTQELNDQAVSYDQEVQAHAVGYDHIPWADAKVIIGGDMNSDANYDGMTYLRNAGYVDSWYAAHPDHFDDGAAYTNCGDPLQPRFNPMTTGANEFPVQNTSTPNQRIDYIYTHGPGFRVLASTQVFTQQDHGVWMSDHYGLLSTIAVDDPDAPAVPNPLTDHDADPLPMQKIVQIDDGFFAACRKHVDCEIDLGTYDVNPQSGVVFLNNSWDTLGVKVKGSGWIIPASSVTLANAQVASFAFADAMPGDYRLEVMNSVGDLAKAVLHVGF